MEKERKTNGQKKWVMSECNLTILHHSLRDIFPDHHIICNLCWCLHKLHHVALYIASNSFFLSCFLYFYDCTNRKQKPATTKNRIVDNIQFSCYRWYHLYNNSEHKCEERIASEHIMVTLLSKENKNKNEKKNRKVKTNSKKNKRN